MSREAQREDVLGPVDDDRHMLARARNVARSRDFYAGGLMILLGLVAAWVGPSYGLGTLTRMGPGFMPMALGIILILLGVAIAASASAEADGEGVLPAHPQWRGWACVLAGPILFIVCGSVGGLIPASFACVFVSALGDRTATLKSSFVLAIVVTAFGVGLFSYILQVPMPILTWGGT